MEHDQQSTSERENMKLQKLKIEKALRIQFLNHFRYFCSFCRGLLLSFSLSTRFTIVLVLSIEYFYRCAPGVFPNIIQVVKQYHCLCFVWTKRGSRSLRAAGSHERLGEMWSHKKSKKKQTDIEFLLRLHPDSCRHRSGKSPVCLKAMRPPTLPSLPMLADVQVGTWFPASRWLLVARGKISTQTSDWSHTRINRNTYRPP